MKTLKSTLVAIIILFTSAAVSNAKTKRDQPSQTDVVNIYVNAITNGKTSDLNKYLSDNLEYDIKRGSNDMTMNKTELMDYLQENSGTGNPVSTNVTVLQQDDNATKIQVDFKYDGYTRCDVIQLHKAFGWEITSVKSSYK